MTNPLFFLTSIIVMFAALSLMLLTAPTVFAKSSDKQSGSSSSIPIIHVPKADLSSSSSSSNSAEPSTSSSQHPTAPSSPSTSSQSVGSCPSGSQNGTCLNGNVAQSQQTSQTMTPNIVQCGDGSVVDLNTASCPNPNSTSTGSSSSSSGSSHHSINHKNTTTANANNADSKLSVYTCISGNVTNAINNAIVRNGNGSVPITNNQTWMNMTINAVAGCVPSLAHLISGHAMVTTTKLTPINIENQLSQARSKVAAMSTSTDTKNFLAGVMKQARQDGNIGIRDSGSACANLTNGTLIDQCIKVYNENYNIACKLGKFGCQS